jgi:hypothetical protein
MQRIAALLSLSTVIVFFGGCAGDDADRKPLDPIYATRKPEPPRAYTPTPQPLPRGPVSVPAAKSVEKPVSTNLDTAALVPPGGIRRGRWNVIVVHHSESPKSTPAGMDSWHRQRGWKGLGYHLVIGNGIGYADGQVFVGTRWRSQSTGAHTGADAGTYFGAKRPDNFFNEHGIGICLIGNFEQSGPTPKQMATLQQLIAFLCSQTGIPPTRIYGHGEVTHKTQCPGRLMQSRIAGLRQSVARTLACEGTVDEPDLAYALAHGIEIFESASCGDNCGVAEDSQPRFSRLNGYFALAADADLDSGILVAGRRAECTDIADGCIPDSFDDIVDLKLGLRGRTALCNLDDHDAGLDR